MPARGCWRWMARATSSLPVPLFAADQDGGIGRRHLRHKLVYVAHARADADHVVLDVNSLVQARVLRFQPFQAARIFKGQARTAPTELASSRWSSRKGALRIEVSK